MTENQIIFVLVGFMLSWPLSVMFAGRMLSVGNQGFGSAISTVVLSLISLAIVASALVFSGLDEHPIFKNAWMGSAFGLLILSPVFAFTLRTSFVKGLLVQIISSVILGGLFFVAVLGFGLSTSDITQSFGYGESEDAMTQKKLDYLSNQSNLLED